jgi:hypothetical protein
LVVGIFVGFVIDGLMVAGDKVVVKGVGLEVGAGGGGGGGGGLVDDVVGAPIGQAVCALTDKVLKRKSKSKQWETIVNRLNG